MSLQTRLGAVLLAAAATGCATNEQPAQGSFFDRARQATADFIKPSDNQNQNATADNNNTGSNTANVTVVAKKGPSIIWNDAACVAKSKEHGALTAGRKITAQFTSLNDECVFATTQDTARGSKVAKVTNAGKIVLESCSPSLAGAASSAASTVGSSLIDRGLAAGGKMIGNFIGNIGGGVAAGAGNVVSTTTQRQATESAKGAKESINTNLGGLSAEQKATCLADTKIVSDAIKADVKGFEADFVKANKGVKTSTTVYSGTADLTSLQLTAGTRAPSRQ